eukprot:1157281-Pelagomonas_calceolata.AAC.5
MTVCVAWWLPGGCAAARPAEGRCAITAQWVTALGDCVCCMVASWGVCCGRTCRERACSCSMHWMRVSVTSCVAWQLLGGCAAEGPGRAVTMQDESLSVKSVGVAWRLPWGCAAAGPV